MYGLRGVIHFKIRVSSGKKNLHSGINGGGVSEPLTALVALLATLVDVDGQVRVPHFYDNVRPVSKTEKDMYSRIDLDLTAYKEKFGLAEVHADSKEELLMKQWRYPTMSVHGIVSSSQNNPTSIPCSVEGLVSLRFVPDQRAEILIKLVTEYLQQEFVKFSTRIPGVKLEVETTKVGDWWLAEHDSVYFKAAEAALRDVWNTQPLYIREGGTIPLTSYMERALNAPALLLPIGQASDSAHLHNERIRLENLKKGKDVFKKFFLNLGDKRYRNSGPPASSKV
jgi:di- and tripeptidase